MKSPAKHRVRNAFSRSGPPHFTVVLEQLCTNESVYLFYYFASDAHEKYRLSKQKYDVRVRSIQRCGLSFSVDPIYGSMHGVASASETEKCAICLDNDANTIFIPCRHMCLCEDCGKILIKSNNEVCPICRKPYSSLIAYNKM